MANESDFPKIGTRSERPGEAIVNPDGSRSSERTITIETDGKYHLIRTIIEDKEGYLTKVSNEEAIKRFQSGENQSLGTFNSETEANDFSRERSAKGGRFQKETPMTEQLYNEQRPPPAPSGVMPGQPEFNEETPSAQEQGDYEQIVTKAVDFMGQNAEATVASMNNKHKPIHENVGELAVKIVKTIEGQAKAAGAEVGMDVWAAAGEEVIEHLMELGENGGIFPFEHESDEYAGTQAMALAHAAKVAGEQLIASPQYTPEMKDEAGTIFAQQVAEEQRRGEVDPSFYDNMGNAVVQGNRRAVEGQ